MEVVATIVAMLLLGWVSLLFVRVRWLPVGAVLFVPRWLAQALTPVLAAVAALVAAVAAVAGWWWASGTASAATIGAVTVVLRVGAAAAAAPCVAAHPGAVHAPRPATPAPIGPRWTGPLTVPAVPPWDHDVDIAAEGDEAGPLLADVWRPARGIKSSGVAVVFLHGSAWTVFDKDAGTRELFGHLAAAGHVVVDVAYRLFPTTDVPGMVHDVRRAVDWARTHAGRLGIDPDRVVLVGESAGGHLALLAAYAWDDATLGPLPRAAGTPTVAAVASLYGQADLAALYDHTGQARSTSPDDPQPDWDAPAPAWVSRLGANAARYRLHLVPYAGRLDWLVGARPDEDPALYETLSPLHRVHAGCPPTLLVHGTLDVMAPVSATVALHERLVDAGVPTSLVLLPHTDHAFDVVATRWSPPARAMIDLVDRLLDDVATGAVPRMTAGQAAGSPSP